jgi:hypothetical protein
MARPTGVKAPLWAQAIFEDGMARSKRFSLQPTVFGKLVISGAGSFGAVTMTDDSGGLSWEAQEVLQKIKSFNQLPGVGIPLIKLNLRVGSAKIVKKGIRELESAGLITSTPSGEPTLTDRGYKTSV